MINPYFMGDQVIPFILDSYGLANIPRLMMMKVRLNIDTIREKK